MNISGDGPVLSVGEKVRVVYGMTVERKVTFVEFR